MQKRLLTALVFAAVASALAGGLDRVSAEAVQATISREDIALAADRIRADRWYDAVTTPGAAQAMRQNRNADMDLLLLALKQPFPELRAAAIREFGRFELAQNASLIAAFLADPVASVKREAAQALVQTLWDKTVQDAAPTVQLLDQYLLQERSVSTTSAFWDAIAELPLDVATARKYERRFVDEIQRATPLTGVAQRALLTLSQHRRGRPLMAETERQVMEWARKGLEQGDIEVKIGTTSLGPTIGYLEILQAAQADADDIAFRAATFFCRRVLIDGCGFDIRRLGVELLNSSNPAHVPVLLDAARGRADIRAATIAIRSLLKSPAVTRCQLLDIARKTPAELDVIAALAEESDERKGECGDWSPDVALKGMAEDLMSSTRGTDWLVPAGALEALARRAPDTARPIATEVAAVHPRWQVRAAAARVAGRIKDHALAMKLAGDVDANVQTAALEAMRLADSPGLNEAARNALSKADYQLVRTAAVVLKGRPEAESLIALFEALRRLTEQGSDSSRRARIALLDRIEEFLPDNAPDTPARAQVIEGLLRDFDPLVAQAAGELLRKSSPTPVEVRPTHRPAQQPSAVTLRTLPPCVLVSLEGEHYLTIVLNRKVAPVAVARFLASVRAGSYANSVFYRDDENLTVIGDHAANDEGFWPRFARDEPGSTVRFLSVTLLNHGPDTVDGRLAIRWRANPELDRRETVIGQGHAQEGALGEIQLGKVVEKMALGGEARVAAAGPGDPCNPLRPW